MPASLTKGYYVLAVTASSKEGKSTQYVTLYSDPEHALTPYIEEVKNLGIPHTKTLFVIIWILVAAIIGVLLSYILRKRLLSSEEKYPDIIKGIYEQGFISETVYDGFIGKKHIDREEVENTERVADAGVKVVVEENKNSSMSISVEEKKKIANIFLKCPKDKEFVLNDGTRMSSIKELIEGLESMTDSTFQHHVNSERNDFANWINDIFKEEELALKVRTCRNREELLGVLK